MRPRPPRSYQLASPRFLLPALNAPQPEAPPLQVFSEAAAEEDTDKKLEYALDALEFLEVASNAVVLVDAAVQVSRLPLAASLPNPIRAVRIEGMFSALIGANSVFPVFEVPQEPPPLPTLYAILHPLS